jgi:hypothetical protein
MDKLTREQILNMPAGKEMDQAITTWVMKEYIPFFHPSTLIAAAWKMVEKFHKDYSMVLDYDDPETIEELKWSCTFMYKAEPYHEYEARANTAPLVICRAALLAVMEDEK